MTSSSFLVDPLMCTKQLARYLLQKTSLFDNLICVKAKGNLLYCWMLCLCGYPVWRFLSIVLALWIWILTSYCQLTSVKLRVMEFLVWVGFGHRLLNSVIGLSYSIYRMICWVSYCIIPVHISFIRCRLLVKLVFPVVQCGIKVLKGSCSYVLTSLCFHCGVWINMLRASILMIPGSWIRRFIFYL